MSAEKLSRTTLTERLVLTFATVFAVVLGVFTILQFLGLVSYAPLVAGAVAGATSAAVNIILEKRRNRNSKS